MNKSEFDISNLKKCIDTLKTCSNDYKNINDVKMREYIADACVKRFEYTVEISWKLMKRYLKLEYGKEDKELTMNNIFRLMEGYGFIKSWESWKYYYEKRNNTSHEYNKEKAADILKITEKLYEDAEFLYKKFSESMVN